ncbi:MAG: preprotein translocase subunit YajC [Lentisphaeria bacterium]
MESFFSQAQFFVAAAGSAVSGKNAIFTQMLILVPLFGIMYFLMIRPQKKKQQELQAMLRKIKAGDKVMLNSGAIGVVSKVSEKNIKVMVAEGVNIEFVRSAVAAIIKDEDASEDKKK